MLTRKKALWKMRMAVSFFFFVQGVIFASWANRIADVKVTLGLDERELGTVLFAIPVGQVTAMMLSGLLVNKYGSRRMMVLGSALYALCLVPLAFASTAAWLMAGLFFFGMAANLCNASANTQAIGAERYYGKTIMASFHALWSMGGFLGGLISMGFVAAGLGPKEQFIGVFALVLISINIFRGQLVQSDVKAAEALAEREPHKRFKMLDKLDGFVVFLGFMAFCGMVCEGCMYDWSGVYFKEVVAVPDGLVQLGYVVCLSTMSAGRFVSDFFVMRFGRRAVVMASGLLIFTGMSAAVLFPHIVPATLGFLLVGFGISSTVPICYSLAGHSAKMNSAMAVTTVASVGYLGFLLGPPCIGHLAKAISLRYTFGVIALMGLVLVAGAMHFPKRNSWCRRSNCVLKVF